MMFFCFLQQLQRNVVFGAKMSTTYDLLQNKHQQLVLCAISSGWEELGLLVV
jgi:hypothetical protein